MKLKSITRLLTVLEDLTGNIFSFEVLSDNSVIFKRNGEMIGSFHNLESLHTYILSRAFNSNFINEGCLN